MVMGDYFHAMGIPVIEGHAFEQAVDPAGPRVAVVDEILAKKQFLKASAIGQQLNFGGPRNYVIVGVVRSINDADLARPIPEEHIYLSAEQIPLSAMGLVVKTGQDPESIAAELRQAVRAVDPQQAIAKVGPMDQWVSGASADAARR